MSVNPGFGGHSFRESQVKMISKLRRLCTEKGVNPWIEVDGGVGPKSAYKESCRGKIRQAYRKLSQACRVALSWSIPLGV